MKKYIIKKSFTQISDLNTTKDNLRDAGISRDDIDYVTHPKKRGKGLKFVEGSKCYILGWRFMLLGALFGFLAYFFYLFQTSDLDYLGTMLSFEFSSLLSSLSITMVIFYFIGFLIGRRFTLHFVQYSKLGSNENIVLAVNANEDEKEKIEQIINSTGERDFTIVDSKSEVEAGIRHQ